MHIWLKDSAGTFYKGSVISALSGSRISALLASQKHSLSLLETYANQSGYQKDIEAVQGMEAEMKDSEEQLLRAKGSILDLQDLQKVEKCFGPFFAELITFVKGLSLLEQ